VLRFPSYLLLVLVFSLTPRFSEVDPAEVFVQLFQRFFIPRENPKALKESYFASGTELKQSVNENSRSRSA